MAVVEAAAVVVAAGAVVVVAAGAVAVVVADVAVVAVLCVAVDAAGAAAAPVPAPVAGDVLPPGQLQPAVVSVTHGMREIFLLDDTKMPGVHTSREFRRQIGDAVVEQLITSHGILDRDLHRHRLQR